MSVCVSVTTLQALLFTATIQIWYIVWLVILGFELTDFAKNILLKRYRDTGYLPTVTRLFSDGVILDSPSFS